MTKKVEMSLIGVDGNAFVVMAEFQKHAREQDWTQDEIEIVLDDAQSGDYNHLLATIHKHITG